jgi:hypothetical protein
MVLLADDDVIVNGDAERLCDRNDLLRHLKWPPPTAVAEQSVFSCPKTRFYGLCPLS